MSWGETLVEDIALVKGGKRLPSGHSFADSPTDHIYIRARDIGGGKIEIKEPVYLTETTRNILQHYTVKEGDVVVTIVGANVGDVGYVNEELSGANLTENAAKLVVDKSRYDPYFLKLLLATESSKKRLAFIASGAAQGKLGLYKIKSFPVVAPPIDIQRKIAAIGRNYDDLIENNRQRIQLLEESARLLYREWFVRLRFPGHEHVKIIDGVPEGWEKKHLSDLVDTQYGFTETASDEPIGPKFLRGTDINKTSYIDWSTVPYCPETKLDFNKYALKRDDILVIRMADPGKVAIVEKDVKAVFASYLVRLTRKEGVTIPPLYLFYVLSDDLYQGFITGASGGATRKSASAKLLVDFKLLIPPPSLVSLFVEQVHPLRRQIGVLLDQNASLRSARDLLLPRLMHGEIAV